MKKTSFLIQSKWNNNDISPLISIIIPTKNEEHISKCLSSIIKNDYPHYEIIIVVDDEKDNSISKIQTHFNETNKIKLIVAKPRPQNWLGKTWACQEGYRNSTGNYLLFLDSDTLLEKNIISSAIKYLNKKNLDAISIIPRYCFHDRLSKLTILLTNLFRFTILSPVLVNDPNSTIGYFLGHFILIKKSVYEKIGTHDSVKYSLIEDDELGRKAKQSGFKINLLRGEGFFSTPFPKMSNNFVDLVKRTVIPLYLRDKPKVLVEFSKSFLFLVLPYIVFIISVTQLNSPSLLFPFFILPLSILCICLIHHSIFLTIKKTLDLPIFYIFGVTISCFVLVFGYVIGIIFSIKNTSIKWRGTTYYFQH